MSFDEKSLLFGVNHHIMLFLGIYIFPIFKVTDNKHLIIALCATLLKLNFVPCQYILNLQLAGMILCRDVLNTNLCDGVFLTNQFSSNITFVFGIILLISHM